MLLLTGASGFLGRHVLNKFHDHSPAVAEKKILPVYNRNRLRDAVALDLTDATATEALLDKYPVEAVIHLAAEARPGVCREHPELAIEGNVRTTENLLNACRNTRPYFLFVSTDMVFKGDRGSYTETDATDSDTVYGCAKIQAENLVQGYDGPWAIVRPSLIYGQTISGRGSSLSWTLDTIRSGNGKFFIDEIRTPVWADDLATLLIRLADRQGTGIIHAGGPDRLSRLDFAQMVAETWDIKAKIAEGSLADNNDFSWRPRDLTLVTDTAQDYHRFTDTTAALKSIKEQETL